MVLFVRLLNMQCTVGTRTDEAVCIPRLRDAFTGSQMRWIPTKASSVRTLIDTSPPRLSEVAAAAKSVTLQAVGHQKSVDRNNVMFRSRDGASSPPTPREEHAWANAMLKHASWRAFVCFVPAFPDFAEQHRFFFS